jgi:putative oxidoreductase
MKSIVKTPSRSVSPTVIPIRPHLDANLNGSFAQLVFHLDAVVIAVLRRWSVTVLRLALGSVFLWFGALKIFGASPVILLLQQTYSFLPIHVFLFVLGLWEMLIGVGIILRRALRFVLTLLCIHLVGTFFALLLNPYLFFVQGVPFCLTADGEFVMKNVVLISAALVIAGHEVKPLSRR